MTDNSAQIIQPNKVRVFHMRVYITGWLEGKFDDWPDSIKDKILEALEKKSQEVQLPLTILDSVCDMDYGEAADGSQDRPYLHVIASEIVVMDTGFAKRKEDALRQLIDMQTKGRMH